MNSLFMTYLCLVGMVVLITFPVSVGHVVRRRAWLSPTRRGQGRLALAD
jgi:hypothetical protein